MVAATRRPAPGRRAPSVLLLSWRDRAHPDAGGAEVYLEHVAAHLAADGWDVTIFTAAHRGAPTEEHADGIRRVRRGGRLSVYAWGAMTYLMGRLGRPDVVVDVQNGVPFFAAVWSRRPVVVLCHHVHERQWRFLFGPVVGRVGWWVESRVAPRLHRRARWVTVSPSTRADLARLGVDPSRVAIVHNGTDRVLSPATSRSPTPRLVVLGRLVPHKRVELAIDTVVRLRARHPDLHLDVLGDGEWRAQLEAHAVAAGVGDRVTFHGHVDEQTKRRLLQRAWLMLLPSVKEGWGLVLMEAAALGVPAVAFREAGGVTDAIVDGRTGVVVDDLDGFVGAVDELLGDRLARLRLGRAAELRSRQFSWQATGEAFARVLQEEVGATPRGGAAERDVGTDPAVPPVVAAGGQPWRVETMATSTTRTEDG